MSLALAFLALRRRLTASALVVLSLTFAPAAASAEVPSSRPIEFRRAAVVSVSAPASEVGASILRDGGNAVDAAVATAFALAVTYPAAGNIGGGGFLLVHPAPGAGAPAVIDYREQAPAAADPEMFARAGPIGLKVVGVPGTVRGLAEAHRRFGSKRWASLIAPAIGLARDGFVVNAPLAGLLNDVLHETARERSPELHRVFACPVGRDWRAGDRLVQPDLAATLGRIAEDGPDAFYLGEAIAGRLADEVRDGGGLITRDDLAAYRPAVRTPIVAHHRGFDVIVPGPPSGGVCLVEELNILESFDLKAKGRWSPESLHLMIEAARRAYRDRAEFLGDPAFTAIPDRLIEPSYARRLAQGIDPAHATRSDSLAGPIPIAERPGETTHFSVVDPTGMAVANTYTLERMHGCRVVVRGCGFLLNDEMNDFNPRPGVTDTAGRIGTAANVAAPGKRMLSSMTPTIVARDGRVLLVTGSPGGRTIINTVLNVLVGVLDFGMDVQAAVDAPRFHHGWLPDTVTFEAEAHRLHPDLLQNLREMGHRVLPAGGIQGDAHTIRIDPATGVRQAAPDHRRGGAAAGF